MTPRDHIRYIRDRYLNSDKEFVLSSLNKSIDRIEKDFPRYGSFLMEFIQNADDAYSDSIMIEIVVNAIRIFNDGRTFSKSDVDSICRIGLSSKTPKDYIGYLGVGFKSVFLTSDSPEIHSGDYKFRFSKDHFSESELIPWQVIPLWIENPFIELPSGYTTAFNIPIKDRRYLEKLQEEIKPEYVSNRMLLFLRNLRNIEIKNALLGTKRVIKKFRCIKTDQYDIYSIQEDLNEELKTQEYWLVFRSVCEVPAYVKEDPATKEWERGKVDKREVIVAFRLDEEENMIIEEKGTAHMGVFSFLPLKEVPSGLNFLIQADFLTTPGRGELARECAWNDWLAKEIYKLIVEKCIPVFIRDDKWKMNFVEVLYSPQGGHELFENNIKRPLREYLETHPCLVAVDGSMTKPDEAIRVSLWIKRFVTENDLKRLYPDKKFLAFDCKIPRDFERSIEKEPLRAILVPATAKNWTIFSDNEKVERIRLFKKLWEDKEIFLPDLSFLTLKTKSGKWLKPKEIIFPKEYRPGHQIERLKEKGLFDLDVEFVSIEFIEGESDEEIRRWYDFFKRLDVDMKVKYKSKRKSIVQRIGILTALQFEKNRGRTARELGESEKLGYDIESRSEVEERFIEVKSSSLLDPDISITPSELKALRERGEKYFVYVIRNALTNPTLYVIRGDKLLKRIRNAKITIPFNKWWDAKDEEFQDG